MITYLDVIWNSMLNFNLSSAPKSVNLIKVLFSKWDLLSKYQKHHTQSYLKLSHWMTTIVNWCSLPKKCWNKTVIQSCSRQLAPPVNAWPFGDCCLYQKRIFWRLFRDHWNICDSKKDLKYSNGMKLMIE